MEMKLEKGKNRKAGKLVIEGNAFYELDTECMEKKKKHQMVQEQKKRRQRS